MVFFKSFEEAVSICCENTFPLSSEFVHINSAFMRVAADNIFTTVDVPGFNCSMMDGFTIGQADLEKLQSGGLITLRIAGTIEAGTTENRTTVTGETYKIMTGALLPEGCVAILKQEEVNDEEDFIVASGSWMPGDNIRCKGSEFGSGDLVAAKGQLLKTDILERIAACGINRIPVHKIPRIYVMDTGNELLLPGSPIKEGQIYSSIRTLIAGKILANGAIPILADTIVEDNLQEIANELEKAIQISDMIIISGGTGNGICDLVFSVYQHLNAKPLFRGNDTVPGKGTSAALIDGKLLFNIPGNPGAAGILFEALIMPALLKLKGDISSTQEWFEIQLGSPILKIRPCRSLYRGIMVIEQGRAYAHPINRQKKIIEGHIQLLLELQGGQGKIGDMVKAKIY